MNVRIYVWVTFRRSHCFLAIPEKEFGVAAPESEEQPPPEKRDMNRIVKLLVISVLCFLPHFFMWL